MPVSSTPSQVSPLGAEASASPFHPASLSQRAAELGGNLHIAQPAGLDTELVILIPLL